MTNEAVAIELYEGGAARNFTVADGTGVSKGTLMVARDPVTAIKSSASGNEYFIGIASADKEANDGATTLGLWTRGRFDIYCGSDTAVSAGQMVEISGANTVELANDDAAEEHGRIVGKALEDSATGTAETIAVAVGY